MKHYYSISVTLCALSVSFYQFNFSARNLNIYEKYMKTWNFSLTENTYKDPSFNLIKSTISYQDAGNFRTEILPNKTGNYVLAKTKEPIKIAF